MKKNSNPWFFVAMATAVAFISWGIRSSFGVFVIPLERAFGLTRQQAILPLSLSFIIQGVMQPFTGAFMDAKGSRKAILVAVILSTLGLVVTAGSQNLWQLTLSYGLLMGIAATGLSIAAFSLLISNRFEQQRGRALGLILGIMRMSTLAFSPLLATLIIYSNWQNTFLFSAAIMLLVVLPLSWFFLREPDKAKVNRDIASLRGGWLFNSEVRRAITTRSYWLLLVTYLGCGVSALFLFAHLPAMAMEYGFSPREGATALGLVGAIGGIGAFLFGWASDRFGRYNILIFGYLMRGVGFFLFAFYVSDVTSLYTISIIYGLTSVATVTMTQLLIYEIFGARIAGRMMGLTLIMHQVVGSLSPYFGGWIFETTGSYMLALVIGGVILFNSVFWSWRLKSETRRHVVANTNS